MLTTSCRRLAGLCALGQLLAVGLLSAGQGSYWDLVDSYRLANRQALPRIRELPRRDVEASIDEAVTLSRPPGDHVQRLLAAGVLHTEAWHRTLPDGARDEGDFHLKTAERALTAALDAAPREAHFVRRWYVVVSGILLNHGRSRDAEQVKARAAKRLTPTADASRSQADLDIGLSHEYQGALSGGRPRGGVLVRPVGRDVRVWAAAALRYRSSLKFDPANAEASLHLGRVLMLMGSEGEASEHFRKATLAADPRVAYLGHLFAGALDEHATRRAEAQDHYEKALLAYPSSQSAVLALSQLFRRSGRELDAHRLLLAFMQSQNGRAVDPLWTYLRPSSTDGRYVLALFDELRVEILK